jgi:hypothetical protein
MGVKEGAGRRSPAPPPGSFLPIIWNVIDEKNVFSYGIPFEFD